LLPCLTCNALTKGHRQNANSVPIRAVQKTLRGMCIAGATPCASKFLSGGGFFMAPPPNQSNLPASSRQDAY